MLISTINKIFFIREMQTKTSSSDYQENKCRGRSPEVLLKDVQSLQSQQAQHKTGTYTEGPPDQLHRPRETPGRIN